MMGKPDSPARADLDEHERTRLEVVSLACEIAVLADLMDSEAARCTPEQERGAGYADHRRFAQDVLAPQSRLAGLSQQRLQQLLDAARERVQQVRMLRNTLARSARRT